MPPTDAPLSFLLDVWKEVGRHADLAPTAARLFARLERELGLSGLCVRRIDLASARIETAAAHFAGGEHESGAPRTELAPPDLDRLREWFRQGAVRAFKTNETDGLRRILEPTGRRVALLAAPLAAPLADDGKPAGVLLLESASDALVNAAAWADALREPLSVALANDVRAHELARLREAAEADNRALLSRLQREDISESVVGASTGLREVMERVEQVARTDAPVLILGETGSGKEVVARNIHSRSRRAKGPFLRVNCGAIPPELVDSELFGHERGSFTGAVNTRRGWFERADGGTLFLDELGELPAAAQVRLLRVLQDGSFERVGGQEPLHVDVRLVAATHRDMETLVGDGTFRQDLWYRINVFPIRLPPLRERAADIPALAAHFASRAGLRLYGVALTPTPEELRVLVEYEWPGNVRELASVIERAAILGDGRHLALAAALGSLPRAAHVETLSAAPLGALDVGETQAGGAASAFAVRGAPAGSSGAFASMTGATNGGTGAHPHDAAANAAAEASLDAAMIRHIENALAKTRGRIEGPYGAASLLGINPHTLRSRMRKLGIDWTKFRTSTS
ncbi:MAG: sigma 54-interacting transcriptional regulator [Planctomycetes bacterium]|nr:sigma 54-interacting transcriptional regulator [Planctomycetota bacterium]